MPLNPLKMDDLINVTDGFSRVVVAKIAVIMARKRRMVRKSENRLVEVGGEPGQYAPIGNGCCSVLVMG